MKNIQTETRTIKEIFADRKTDFLIPDYQRPYSWTEDECQTLWNDFCDFAFPNGNADAFDKERDEYFLGVIVTFGNDRELDEIIDGQQRLTTLLLFMRAFYKALGGDDGTYSKIIENLGECIWKTDELGELNKSSLKIVSEVIREDAKDELQRILSTGAVTKADTSNYAAAYSFFQAAIHDLKKVIGEKTLQYLPARIMDKCFLTRIRAESQDFALQMFSTLNDRGLPLSDTDIFKAIMYKFFTAAGKCFGEDFIRQWRELERRAEKTFGKHHGLNVNPLEFLFTCYSYREFSTASKKLRRAYERDNYAVLRRIEMPAELFGLMDFFDDLLEQNLLRFPIKAVRYAHILFRAKNSFIWLIMAHYYLCERDERNHLDGEIFAEFLERLLAFLLAHAITCTSTNALRGYAFRTLSQLKKPVPKGLKPYTFSAEVIRTEMNMFGVKRQKKLMMFLVLNWWTFRDENQKLPPIERKFDIEHIFPKSLADSFENFHNKNSVNLLGNLALLEHGKNNNAASHRFADKRKVYLGFERNGKFQAGTLNRELQQLAQTLSNFGETEIIKRNSQMIAEVLSFVDAHNFLQN